MINPSSRILEMHAMVNDLLNIHLKWKEGTFSQCDITHMWWCCDKTSWITMKWLKIKWCIFCSYVCVMQQNQRIKNYFITCHKFTFLWNSTNLIMINSSEKGLYDFLTFTFLWLLSLLWFTLQHPPSIQFPPTGQKWTSEADTQGHKATIVFQQISN